VSKISITILTIATHWNTKLENFKRSLHKFGYNYEILAFGEKWKGWKWRTKKYLDALLKHSNQKNNWNDLFVLIDSYDVLALKSPDYLLETFYAYETNIVIGSEWYCGNSKNCFPLKNIWKDFNHVPYRQYLNAGCIIGKTQSLIDMFQWILNNNYDDDQYGLAQWIHMNNYDLKNVKLDYGSNIFYNSHVLDGYFNTSAFFAHFPGPMLKWGLDPIYNFHCKNVLKNNASLQQPSILIESSIWFILLMCIVIKFIF
jgi:hypothetical protein